MTDKLTGGPKPDPNFVRRGPSGDHLTPEGAKANFTGGSRGQYPKGSEPKPGQSVTPGPSGSSQDGSFGKGSPAAPIATRNGGERKNTGSRSNPFPTRSGGGLGKSGSSKQPL